MPPSHRTKLVSGLKAEPVSELLVGEVFAFGPAAQVLAGRSDHAGIPGLIGRMPRTPFLALACLATGTELWNVP